MTYDQAQSSRLGQRVPVESTYVQIVNTDPDDTVPNLFEAAYPGQLIFNNDRGVLMIWNHTLPSPTWQDVAGGVAGQLTYVGPDEPTGTAFSIGDIWFDSDDGYKQYVWDGDEWVLSTAAGGVLTFRQGQPPPTSVNIGDIWYNSDALNAMYRAAVVGATELDNPDAVPPVVGWVLVQDGNIATAQAKADQADSKADTNAQGIGTLNTTVANLALTATSANNSADTADGRVMMSDYEPGDDDKTFWTHIHQLDTSVDPPVEVEVEYEAPRPNGSLWYVRTRPRLNVCTNPSFEDATVNLRDWTQAPGTTQVRDEYTYVPAGKWTTKCTNGATGPFWVAWGQNNRPACAPNDTWTASVYAELISGTSATPGADITLEILWYDAAGTYLSSKVSDPYDMLLNAFVDLGTAYEPRLFVTGTAPANAASFYVRQNNPNPGDVWHTGAMLVEQEDDLGRYFDGDSPDGYWTGGTGDPAKYPEDNPGPGEQGWQESTSRLRGNKIQQVWELRDGFWIRKYYTEDTLYLIDVAKLIGELNAEASIKDNTIAPDKMVCALVKTSEALAAGDMVNVYNNSGEANARKADAGARLGAHGFVLSPFASGATAKVYHLGYVSLLSNMVPGPQYLSAGGAVTNRPPAAVGGIVQRVGVAMSDTWLAFEPNFPIRII